MSQNVAINGSSQLRGESVEVDEIDRSSMFTPATENDRIEQSEDLSIYSDIEKQIEGNEYKKKQYNSFQSFHRNKDIYKIYQTFNDSAQHLQEKLKVSDDFQEDAQLNRDFQSKLSLNDPGQ